MVHQKSFTRMSLTWILLVSLVVAPQLFAWVHQGDMIINNQSDIDAIRNGIEEVTGDLIISGNDISNLNQLLTLKTIGGTLTIKDTPNLKNLDGLSSLKTAETVDIQVQVKSPQMIPQRVRDLQRQQNSR